LRWRWDDPWEAYLAYTNFAHTYPMIWLDIPFFSYDEVSLAKESAINSAIDVIKTRRTI